MPTTETSRLIGLAEAALKATREGRLTWQRTREQPPEYYSHPTGNSGMAISRLPLPPAPSASRAIPFVSGIFKAALTAQAAQEARMRAICGYEDEPPEPPRSHIYVLTITRTDAGEIGKASSAEPGMGTSEYRALEDLFNAAQRDAEGFDESVEEIIEALSCPTDTGAG